MTDEQINIAIAEACGWQFVPSGDSPTEFGWKAFPESWLNPDGETDSVPDYVNDLNEMAKAEATITDHTGYVMELKRSTGEFLAPFFIVTATAKQRAEAFLRTKGKWSDK